MNFTEATNDEIGGTCLQGVIDIPYHALVKMFGEPHSQGDGYKTDAEWCIKFEDGTVATIYNYKDGKNYEGDEGLETEDIDEWHIGGHDRKVLELVMEVIG